MRGYQFAWLLMAGALAAMPTTVAANDSMAELKTGGLRYIRTEAVRMEREDLFISADQITVDYVFENKTDKDVESLIAFPMPSIIPDPYDASGVPVDDTNFLGFRVFIEGEEIQPELSQRASVLGVDVTEEIYNYRLPLLPIAESTRNELGFLPEEVLSDWLARGLVFGEEWDAGEGMQSYYFPAWTLDQTYYWTMTFPAGQQVRVSHSYTPSVGGSAGTFFLDWDGYKGESYAEYEERYCIDPPFVNAVKKRLRPEGGIAMYESWISYILTTGRNWSDSIGTFHLTVDKGSTSNLVSFCGTGVKKTGPTRFELTYEDYYPDRELDILIMEPASW